MSSDSLTRIRKLGATLVAQQAKVELLTEDLRAAKAARDATQLNDLPLLMTEVGMTSFSLADGSEITVTEDVRTSITAAHAPAAFAWLDANGFGGLIRTKIEVEYPRDKRDVALSVSQQMSGDPDAAVRLKATVHPQTLRSFVREQIAAGRPIPMDLLSVSPFNKAEVKVPKK
jgi:hypothetical protein